MWFPLIDNTPRKVMSLFIEDKNSNNVLVTGVKSPRKLPKGKNDTVMTGNGVQSWDLASPATQVDSNKSSQVVTLLAKDNGSRKLPVAATPNSRKLQEALAYFSKHTIAVEVCIHPLVLLYLWPFIFNKEGNLVANIPQVNHNNIHLGLVYQILNNMLDDVCNIKPDVLPDMGRDLELFAIHWNKVR